MKRVILFLMANFFTIHTMHIITPEDNKTLREYVYSIDRELKEVNTQKFTILDIIEKINDILKKYPHIEHPQNKSWQWLEAFKNELEMVTFQTN